VRANECTISIEDGVAVLTLQAPERRNILSADMVTDIRAAYEQAEADNSVRCVVLTGAGKAFCAGADLKTLEHAAGGDFNPVRSAYDGFLRVLESPLPTIGAINGAAVGAGFNLALACDVRIAATTAWFDTRFAALNLHPGGGHTWLLSQAVGGQNAAMAVLFGESWDAPAALKLGLVASVYDPQTLLEQTIGLGKRLGSHSPAYVRNLTTTLRLASSGVDHWEVLESEAIAQEWSLKQPEFLGALERIRGRAKSPS
jgi:enoyl-CoA hydratase